MTLPTNGQAMYTTYYKYSVRRKQINNMNSMIINVTSQNNIGDMLVNVKRVTKWEKRKINCDEIKMLYTICKHEAVVIRTLSILSFCFNTFHYNVDSTLFVWNACTIVFRKGAAVRLVGERMKKKANDQEKKV